MKEADIDDVPSPAGELMLQTVAMPKDTNSNGDIFGGWLVSQMDMAAMIAATRIAKGRAVTVAINGMAFYTPVQVGSVVSCYTEVVERSAAARCASTSRSGSPAPAATSRPR
jgi:acyl-CoA thioesterase YciA